MRKLRFREAAGLAILLVFLTVAFTPFPNFFASRLAVPPRIETAEAIVVLGGGMEDSRTLSPASLRRAVEGVRLYRQGLAPSIVFSGGKAGQEAAEGGLMAALALELGVPGSAIWIETESNDTWTGALEVARVARSKGIGRILLVTDPLHMKRARAVFERAGFQVLPAAWEMAAGKVRKPEARLTLMRQVGQEAFARLYYWIRGKL